jgi:hypothetical protein
MEDSHFGGGLEEVLTSFGHHRRNVHEVTA